ncbi:hypothetical Protein YC6258_05627 [Gynuella sunshinyii YC6258]|uniref:Uncharacterized protein n=1 Tax=Gynuella sunshinyii YC6258 TaxID=1445510 RepID=A0A0C5VED6_9GAMM|nr:hypothetical Protein YC6258_05627 [Gynuella sunshinyii YC6258]
MGNHCKQQYIRERLSHYCVVNAALKIGSRRMCHRYFFAFFSDLTQVFLYFK